MTDALNYVAVVDIADRLGVRPSAVSNWAARHADFPAPRFMVARCGTSIYAWDDVRAWAWAHGKGRMLPPPGAPR